MLLMIRRTELETLIPAVATGSQFNSALGSPRKILQRVMISSIIGVILLVFSQSQVTSQFYPIWLILGVISLLYILWSPILEASRRNSKLRAYPYSAIFHGEISDINLNERIINSHEQANNRGELELIENRRTWMTLSLSDEDGYLTDLSFPREKSHSALRVGQEILCLVLCNYKDFSDTIEVSDCWLPRQNLWIGEYPYLLRPAFQELSRKRIKNYV